MKIPDKVYNVLKWLALTVIPALTTLYGVIGTAFNIPYTTEVLMIMPAISTFIGSLIGVSTAKYYQSLSQEPQIDKVMVAVEQWFAAHENDAIAKNVDVPEE